MALLVSILAALERFLIPVIKSMEPKYYLAGSGFEPMALEVSGLEMSSTGKASAPTLTMANNINGIQHAVSAYCLQFKDFAGAKLKVITTLAKYLDPENFTSGNPLASNESKEQTWFIEQKTSENAQQVTFELSNPIDFEGLKIPVRQITSYCSWEYRGKSVVTPGQLCLPRKMSQQTTLL